MAAGETYEQFVEKFEPKKTTDDCYTPAPVYDAIRDWVLEQWPDLADAQIVRPFWPGGDYEAYDYPPGCVVIDNPPFSMLAKIRRHYIERGIKYFLFAPALTVMSANVADSIVATNSAIVYDNGAVVRTAFVTNLPGPKLRSAPTLGAAIKKAAGAVMEVKRRPRYVYPPEVINFSVLESAARYGIEATFEADEVHSVQSLDSQRAVGKTIFGYGYLVGSERARDLHRQIGEAKATRTIVWELSERERAIVADL